MSRSPNLRLTESQSEAEPPYECEIYNQTRYHSLLTPYPKAPRYDDTTMTDDISTNKFFDDILSCPRAKLVPDAPPYMRTHLRTIGVHFAQADCWITVDVDLSRTPFHLSRLPNNYPWIFIIEVHERDEEVGNVLTSTRCFFRDLEGEVDYRPYVQITTMENMDYIHENFEVEKLRTGKFFCRAKKECGHEDHWGKQYLVRFLKPKQVVVEKHASDGRA